MNGPIRIIIVVFYLSFLLSQILNSFFSLSFMVLFPYHFIFNITFIIHWHLLYLSPITFVIFCLWGFFFIYILNIDMFYKLLMLLRFIILQPLEISNLVFIILNFKEYCKTKKEKKIMWNISNYVCTHMIYGISIRLLLML